MLKAQGASSITLDICGSWHPYELSGIPCASLDILVR